MRPGRSVLTRLTVVALLAGSLLAVAPVPAQAASLTPRRCTSVYSGDGIRRLDVCARGWVSDNAVHTRGVVEMHTYEQSAMGAWVDSRSRSITMNEASNDRNGTIVAFWGQDQTQKCRVNSHTGRVACSVANTYRVAFYGPLLFAPNFDRWATVVWHVSWRDDRGIPHHVDWFQSPLISPVWSA
jgi:hypothetical protein